MATPNYGYEKRQKELAKKRKKEDKLKSKSERKVGAEHEGGPTDTPHDGMDSANAGGVQPDPIAPSGT